MAMDMAVVTAVAVVLSESAYRLDTEAVAVEVAVAVAPVGRPVACNPFEVTTKEAAIGATAHTEAAVAAVEVGRTWVAE